MVKAYGTYQEMMKERNKKKKIAYLNEVKATKEKKETKKKEKKETKKKETKNKKAKEVEADD